jgi:hypothetical protein
MLFSLILERKRPSIISNLKNKAVEILQTLKRAFLEHEGSFGIEEGSYFRKEDKFQDNLVSRMLKLL